MKVSVIIPALNAADFIGGAIASVLAQSLNDLEVVVVDDGSTDDTAAIVQGFMARDPRIRLIQHASPKGVSAARNAAVRAARGDWIAILDADDAFEPLRLEHMVAELESRGLDGLADNLDLVDFETKTPLGLAFPRAWMTTGQALTLEELIDKDTPGNHDFRPLGLIKPILNRQRLKDTKIDYAEDIAFAEDFLFYAQLMISGFNIGLTEAPMYIYAVRRGSASNKSALDRNRDTRNFIDVNRRVARYHASEVGASGSANAEQARAIQLKLKHRDQAIKYWRLVSLAKGGHGLAAMNAARFVKPAYLIERMSAALNRRLPWTKSRRLSDRVSEPG